jgi:acyl dehydratase
VTQEVLDAPGQDLAAFDAAAMVGRRYRLVDQYEVGREKIREFAEAVQAHDPAHHIELEARAMGHAGLVAPMTMTAIIGSITQQRIFEEFLPRYDLSQVLHTEQRIVSHRPLIAGDRVGCVVSLKSFRQVHGQDIFVLATDFSDGDGGAVQSNWTTAVARSGGEIDQDLVRAVAGVKGTGVSSGFQCELTPVLDYSGPELAAPVVISPDRRFEGVSVGDLLPARSFELTRGDLVAYAGVSGDPNPIHWSDRIASMVGLDDVVAHGMLSMGIAATYLGDWLGDPGALAELSVRFSSPVFVPADSRASIEFSGRVRSVNAENRTGDIVLTAMSGGRKIFGRAVTTVRLG